MNKTQANEIATSTICHLEGNWRNTTFYNFGWVSSIENVNCPGMTMIYAKGCDDWSVYIEPRGYYASGKTPNLALSNCRKALKEEESKIKQVLFDTQQIINLIENKD